MTQQLTNLEQLPQELRPAIEGFARLVQKLAAANAAGLTLFGAIAARNFDATRHTIRSVLLVNDVDLRVLRRLAEHGAKLGKDHLAAPLIMTTKYIDESRDTFPLELIEILQNRIVLFGPDPFSELTFEDDHVRLQCEREFKVILIGLRQGLLAAAGRERFLENLEISMAENLIRTLRGMLWLKGRREAQPATAVIAEVENITKRKLVGIRNAIEVNANHGWEQYEALYRDVEALGGTVDAW